MDEILDLRSDTVTKPTAEMRRAMAEAEVGDDVFGEDPTVNALQDKAAKLLGKEAALFVCSGTMANQLAIRAQTHHGDEIIADKNCHTVNFESGAVAALCGVLFIRLRENAAFSRPPRSERRSAPRIITTLRRD
jgi:threonine aldolase